jgi:hypothetical protein
MYSQETVDKVEESAERLQYVQLGESSVPTPPTTTTKSVVVKHPPKLQLFSDLPEPLPELVPTAARKETLTLKCPYDESYNVGPTTYGISKTEKGFSVWKSGCKVAEFPDIDQARKNIHERGRMQCVQQVSAAEKLLEEAKDLFTRLSDDWFRIARFERDGQ